MIPKELYDHHTTNPRIKIFIRDRSHLRLPQLAPCPRHTSAGLRRARIRPYSSGARGSVCVPS